MLAHYRTDFGGSAATASGLAGTPAGPWTAVAPTAAGTQVENVVVAGPAVAVNLLGHVYHRWPGAFQHRRHHPTRLWRSTDGLSPAPSRVGFRRRHTDHQEQPRNPPELPAFLS